MDKKREREIRTLLLAGFGGQGIISMGQFLAYAGMLEEREVCFVPAYGPEMRGGTANCLITIDEQQIDSPIFEQPDVAVVMNLPSFNRFEYQVRSKGLLLVNSSLVNQPVQRQDIEAYSIPVNELASSLGNIKVANVVMIGALLELTGIIQAESIIDSMRSIFSDSKHNLLVLNRKALEKGAEYVRYLSSKQRLAV